MNERTCARLSEMKDHIFQYNLVLCACQYMHMPSLLINSELLFIWAG